MLPNLLRIALRIKKQLFARTINLIISQSKYNLLTIMLFYVDLRLSMGKQRETCWFFSIFFVRGCNSGWDLINIFFLIDEYWKKNVSIKDHQPCTIISKRWPRVFIASYCWRLFFKKFAARSKTVFWSIILLTKKFRASCHLFASITQVKFCGFHINEFS